MNLHVRTVAWILAALVVSTYGVTSLAKDAAKPAWRQGAPGCSARFAHSLTYAAAAGGLLLFGGQHTGQSGYVFYDDLWLYEPSKDKWKQIEVKGPKPPPRGYQGAAWDASTKSLWICGGTAAGFQPIDDLWRFDLAKRTWEQITWKGEGPPPRITPQLHLDAKKKRLVMFGGTKGFMPGDIFRDLWFFDLKKRRWTNSGTQWAGRWQGASVHDVKKRRIVSHGGFDAQFVASDDTWVFDLDKDRWTSGEAGYAATDAHAGVWDAKRARMLVYGGATGPIISQGDPGDGLARLAAFDPKKGTWSDIETDGEGPGPRGYHAVGWDPGARILVVFGGTRNQFSSPEHDSAPWLIELGK